MAFDGITVAALAAEFSDKLTGGRIDKIVQPEADELLLTVKKERATYRLTLSANASLPLACLTESTKAAPATAPNFCMLLRKHLLRAKITGIEQPHMERVLVFHLQHYNEMGDLCEKKLIAEFMGKYSNLIFAEEDDRIIDSIKRIPASVSSVREVLPGRTWFIPDAMQKQNPLEAGSAGFEAFRSQALTKPVKLTKALYTSYTGLSPIAAEEITHRAGLDGDRPANVLDEDESLHLYKTFLYFMEDVAGKNFSPKIYYVREDSVGAARGTGREGSIAPSHGTDRKDSSGAARGTGSSDFAGESICGAPKEFSALPLSVYEDDPKVIARTFDSMSAVIGTYYASKNQATRIHQKTADLRKVTSTLLEKDVRKLELQEKQLADTDKRETFRQYGELLTAYGYSLAPGAKELKAPDFATGEEITVPLDPTLTPIENAKRYFEKYSKQKRTREALLQIVEETRAEIEHLQSILAALDIAVSESDLTELRAEMADSGYIRRRQTDRKGAKKEKVTSKPFHYLSSDGIHLYVGKNNYQNEKLTFAFAGGNDWWFHAKKYPGSHVIAKTEGRELKDATCEEAARLAAWYSTGRGSEKVEIDYVERKHVKKVAGAKPGFVIYHTNYSLAIAPDIRGIELVSE